LDIDSYIAKLAYIQDVVTIAIPDEIKENITYSHIILRQEYRDKISPKDIKFDLKSILLDYQIPEHFVFVEHFPTNVSGKVCKKTLKAELVKSLTTPR
jgi:acyl-coenzyme A synthetase/AMP-(fatty) acid ligase